MPTVSKTELLEMAGWESPPGEWMTIDQKRVDLFADAEGERKPAMVAETVTMFMVE